MTLPHSPEAPSVRELSPEATEGKKPPRRRSSGPMRTSAPTGSALPRLSFRRGSAAPPPSQREALAKTDTSQRKRRADTQVRPYILPWVRERRGGPACPPVSTSLSRSRFLVTLALGAWPARLPSVSGWSPGPAALPLALAPVHPGLCAYARASFSRKYV